MDNGINILVSKIAHLVLFIIMSFSVAMAQPQCGNPFMEEFLQSKNPNYFDELNNYIENLRKIDQNASGQRNTITIPVVVHIIHKGTAPGVSFNIPESRIQSQLNILNEDFRRLNDDAVSTPALFQDLAADTQIEFCLANVDPNGNSSSGITRHQYNNIPNTDFIEDVIKPATYWNPSRYLNIWSVPIPSSESYILGYSYLPSNQVLGTHLDGVVLAHDRFGYVGSSGGRTCTHEVGHYLGLSHIFGNSTGSCNTDDGVNDTPNSSAPYYSCPSHPETSCGSTDMFMNYMDYVDDFCMNMFTEGQANVMRFTLNTLRPNLVNAAASVCDLETSLNQIVANIEVNIFPNPASDQVQIELPATNTKQLENIVVFQADGLAIPISHTNNSNVLELNIQHLKSGIYFLALRFKEGEMLVKKLLVTR